MKQLIITIFFGLLLSCQQTNDSSSSEKEEANTELGSFKSKLKLANLQGEELQQAPDKILILNLWATWCAPCIREMPDLVEMQKLLPDDFVLLLASDEEPERVNRFLTNSSFDLEFIRINNSIESLGVYSLPTTFIVGKDGELLETLVGARNWNDEELIKNLKKYLK
ncbi:MAG: TlpA disulfide reductase family protein [Cyclobacteriaceae bacterium]